MHEYVHEEGRGLTLARALEIAENSENFVLQLAARSLDGKGEDSATVNRIYAGSFSKNDGKKRKQLRDTRKNWANTCYRCGNAGNFGRGPGWPARGQSCHTWPFSYTVPNKTEG